MVAAPEGIGLDDADLDDKVQLPVRRSDDFGQPMSGSIALARVPHPTRWRPLKNFPRLIRTAWWLRKQTRRVRRSVTARELLWLIPVLLCIFFE